MDQKETFHIGIEGGGTKTIGVLISSSGLKIAQTTQPGSNPWIAGYNESIKILSTILTTLSEKLQNFEPKSSGDANINRVVASAGLSMSGAGTDSMANKIQKELTEKFLNIGKIEISFFKVGLFEKFFNFFKILNNISTKPH